jgi:P pilus assembly chaperone PapD
MRWFYKSIVKLGVLLITLNTALAQAGVVVGGTRLVYDAGKSQALLSVSNPDKDTDYLIQAWLDNQHDTDSRKAPFVITPPLFRLDAQQENLLRIIHTGEDMPADRESVYWLSVKSIAATERSANNRLQIAIRTRIKLFYRPVNLPGMAEDAYKQLEFTRHDNQLIVTNPTPYFVSFQMVKVGNSIIQNPGMVPPKGSHQLPLPSGAVGKLTWQAINDYGGITKTASQ